MNSRHDAITIGAASAFVVVLLVGFVTLSIATGDGEHLNRGGATILAFAALFVVRQVTREAVADAALHRHKEAGAADDRSRSIVEPSVVARMHALSRARIQTDGHRVRLIYVWFVASITALGELLHGWGALLLETLGVVAGHR